MRRSIPRSSRAFWRLVLALVASLALNSCLDLKADITIARDGSARLKARYAVSKIALSLEALRAEEPLLPFPLTKAGFDEAIARLPGSAILSWKQAETREDLVTDLELSFPDLASLAAFVDPSGKKANYSAAGSGGKLHLELWPGLAGAKSADPDLTRFVESAFAPYSISLSLALPSPVIQAGIGVMDGDRRTASVNRGLADLARSPDPVILDLVW